MQILEGCQQVPGELHEQMVQKQEALASLQTKVTAAEDAGADNSVRIASLQVCLTISLHSCCAA
jgi:hypothetical protein